MPCFSIFFTKKEGETGNDGGASVPAQIKLLLLIFSFHFFHFRFQVGGK
jgi:hypothetical protein